MTTPTETRPWQSTKQKANVGAIFATALLSALLTAVAVVAALQFLGREGGLTITRTELVPVAIPAEGGTVNVITPTKFAFTPDESGLWEVSTSDNFGSDPIISITAPHFAAHSDDVDGGLNARTRNFMAAGVTYIIHADFVGGPGGSFNLHVVRPLLEAVPTDGSSLSAQNDELYSFIPDRTGLWTLAVDRGEHSFSFQMTTSEGEHITSGDSGPHFENMPTEFLVAGTEYIIRTSTWVNRGPPSAQAIVQLRAVYEGGTLQPLPETGGGARVTDNPLFSLTPAQSGRWIIYTTEIEGWADPTLSIYDASTSQLLVFGDSGGAGMNARVDIDLVAGTQYIINARFRGGRRDDYPAFQLVALPEGEVDFGVFWEDAGDFAPESPPLDEIPDLVPDAEEDFPPDLGPELNFNPGIVGESPPPVMDDPVQSPPAVEEPSLPDVYFNTNPQ